MTTIIAMNTADDQAIYADSLVQHGSVSARGYKKFFVLPGIVGGFCGSANGGTGVVTALEDILCQGREPYAFFTHPGRHDTHRMSDFDQREFEMLILYDGKIWLMCEDLIPITVLLPSMAKGSGGPFAMGALATGAPPWLALAIASQYDVGTGEPFFRCDIAGKITSCPSHLLGR